MIGRAGLTVAVEACTSTVGGGAMPTARAAVVGGDALPGECAEALRPGRCGARSASVIARRSRTASSWLDVAHDFATNELARRRRRRGASLWRLDRRRQSRLCAPHMTPRVVAIGGGKGGVGKSLVAANVGIFLATLGKKRDPRRRLRSARRTSTSSPACRGRRASLAEALAAGGPPLAELAVATHVPGVKLIGGVYDPPWIAEPGPAQVRVHRRAAAPAARRLGRRRSRPGLGVADARAVPRGRHRACSSRCPIRRRSS